MSSIHRPSRRALLQLAATSAALVAAPRVFAADPVKLRVGAPHGSIPGVKTAIEEGLFAREGLDISLVTLAGGPNILTAVVGNSLEIGFADLFAWVGALDNGFDLAFLQSANGRGNSDFIIASARSGVQSPRDLKGKKIGVAAHAQSKLRVTLYLERFGLSASDVQFIVINQRDTVGAALHNGQIDAAIAADPNVAQWEQQFKVRILEGRPWEQIPATATTAGFFSRRDWVGANAGHATRFVRAAREGAARYNGYTAEQKARISLKYDKVDLFAVEREVPGTIKRMDDANAAHSGPIDLAATGEWLQVAQKHGTVKKAIDLRPLLLPTATATRV
ncbi:MAG: ABC transporter substrate-binding protein [Burkholderiaceae bacterium]|nr:ABC transporter substrate-binding protein [Burkholderiaceae bacterium]